MAEFMEEFLGAPFVASASAEADGPAMTGDELCVWPSEGFLLTTGSDTLLISFGIRECVTSL
jgi:hypothetical protein